MAEQTPLDAGPPEESDELRELWARLRPPAPDDGLERPDQLTAEAVAWMRAAWKSLEPPPVVRPIPRQVAATPRPTPIWRRLAPLVAAAAVLAVIAPLVLRRGDSTEEPATLDRSAREAPQSSPASGAEATEHEAGGNIALLAADRMELRSGPVRLVLLTPEGSRSETTDEVIR